jgi:hypothetical protein
MERTNDSSAASAVATAIATARAAAAGGGGALKASIKTEVRRLVHHGYICRSSHIAEELRVGFTPLRKLNELVDTACFLAGVPYSRSEEEREVVVGALAELLGEGVKYKNTHTDPATKKVYRKVVVGVEAVDAEVYKRHRLPQQQHQWQQYCGPSSSLPSSAAASAAAYYQVRVVRLAPFARHHNHRHQPSRTRTTIITNRRIHVQGAEAAALHPAAALSMSAHAAAQVCD